MTAFQGLFASLASKLATFDYLTKLFLYLAFTALKGDVLVSEQKTENKTSSPPPPPFCLPLTSYDFYKKLADQVVRTVNRPEATANREKIIEVFGQADSTFKVRTGNFKNRE